MQANVLTEHEARRIAINVAGCGEQRGPISVKRAVRVQPAFMRGVRL
jgi:hypothetical protein